MISDNHITAKYASSSSSRILIQDSIVKQLVRQQQSQDYKDISIHNTHNFNRILVTLGPTGVGKSYVLQRLLESKIITSSSSPLVLNLQDIKGMLCDVANDNDNDNDNANVNVNDNDVEAEYICEIAVAFTCCQCDNQVIIIDGTQKNVLR